METAELSVSEYAQLRALDEFLRQRAREAKVVRATGQPAPGELGVPDWLTVTASSSVLTAIVTSLLPQFLATRKPGLSVKVQVRGVTLEVSGASMSEVEQLLDKVLNA